MRRTGLTALVALVAAAGCTDDVVYIDEGAPAPPRALSASYYAGRVTVSWELAPGWDGEPFRVYSKRTSDSGWFFIAEVTSCIDELCSYDDINVAGGVRYEYYVASVGVDGTESPSDVIVEVDVPAFVPPAVPDLPYVIALDGANFLTWGTASTAAADFSHYRVYLDDGVDAFLLGETDSEGFLDLLAENGVTYGYFVTAVDVDGHESDGSLLMEGTPRPDFTGEWVYDYLTVPESSGFRFAGDESESPILDGDDPARHFRLEADVDGWWLVPGPDAAVHSFAFLTSALKCGPAADADCTDVSVAPVGDYTTGAIGIAPQESYVLRVIGDDGQVHYGVIRISLLGFDQDDNPIGIFDWAYQLQAGNPNLAPQRAPVRMR